MINPTNVYLAGPLTGATLDDACSWRQNVTERLEESGFKVFTPLKGDVYLNKTGMISDRIHPGKYFIYQRDKFYCRESGIILANFLGAKDVSIGTVCEIAWSDILDHYCVVVMENDNIHSHAFIQNAAGFITDDLDDAVFHIIDTFGKKSGINRCTEIR